MSKSPKFHDFHLTFHFQLIFELLIYTEFTFKQFLSTDIPSFSLLSHCFIRTLLKTTALVNVSSYTALPVHWKTPNHNSFKLAFFYPRISQLLCIQQTYSTLFGKFKTLLSSQQNYNSCLGLFNREIFSITLN